MEPRTVTRALSPLFVIAAAAALLTGCASLPQIDEDAVDASPEASASAGEFINVNDLEVGDCWTGAFEGEIDEVELIDCAEPHQSEAFLAFDAPEGLYPAAADFAQMAFDQCAGDPFTQFIGAPYDPAANLQIFYYAPLEEGWDLGDRELLCYVANADGTVIEGSAEGSGGA
jgi:hypothetical protein